MYIYTQVVNSANVTLGPQLLSSLITQALRGQDRRLSDFLDLSLKNIKNILHFVLVNTSDVGCCINFDSTLKWSTTVNLELIGPEEGHMIVM